MAGGDLFDIRVSLWKEAFGAALPYDAYLLNSSPAEQERWRSYEERFTLNAEQKNLLGSFTRQLNVLVLSGAWCGDCARQGPMLARIAAAAPSVNLRFIDNQAMPALRDELRIHGAARVPVAVTLSEDFFEVGRSGDRVLAAYRRKALTEVGAACDAGIVAPPSDSLAEELAQWIEHFERHHLLLRVSPFLRRRHND